MKMRSPIRYLLTGSLFIAVIIFCLFVMNHLSRDAPIQQDHIHAGKTIDPMKTEYWKVDEVPPPLDSLPRLKLYQARINEAKSFVHTSDYLAESKSYRHDIHLRDFIRQPLNDDSEFDFSRCEMSNCFDYSRCNSSGPIKVHILPPSSNQASDFLNLTGESNIIHKNILEIIRRSEYFEPNPAKACIFILSEDTLDRDPLSKSFRSDLPNLMSKELSFGMNRLVFNMYSGSWPDYREDDFAGFKIGAAILVKASNSRAYHRSNYDISIPLFSYLHPSFEEEFPRDQTNSGSTNRSYFLTFKGKRYVVGGGSDTRNSLYHLNNRDDVIMLTTCRHGKKWRESSDKRCLEDDTAYDQYDFYDLMRNSEFCLTPRGRRLGSFRFLEALSYGCIPVVLSDGWVWPFDEIIDWSEAAIQINEDLIFHVSDMLRDITPQMIEILRTNFRKYYDEHLSTTKKIIMTTLAIIEKRIRNWNNQNLLINKVSDN